MLLTVKKIKIKWEVRGLVARKSSSKFLQASVTDTPCERLFISLDFKIVYLIPFLYSSHIVPRLTQTTTA